MGKLDQLKRAATRWWNVQRGYKADGSERIPEFVSDEEIEAYEASLSLKVLLIVRDMWEEDGNPLHPGDEETLNELETKKSTLFDFDDIVPIWDDKQMES
tara:strand:+ start:775 stop:1074 length:300 start_codon:yes stop_codon:yes gene_type:complete